MSAQVYRISVHAGDDGTATDLVVPAHLPLAALLPDIVRLAAPEVGPGRHWRLSRLCGTVLDEDAALADQDVGDGDLLVLRDAAQPLPRFDRTDLATAVAATAAPPTDTRALRSSAGLWIALAGLVAWPVVPPGQWLSTVTAAVTLCGVTAVAVTAGRSGRRLWVGGPLAVLAVVTAAVCASQLTGGPLGPEQALLAAAAAAAMSSVLLRFGLGPPMLLTALVTGALITSAGWCAAVVWRLPVPAVGVVLAVLAFGVLTAAPRISIALTGLAPAASLTDAPVDDAAYRAAAGHRMLTGLVLGCCGVFVFASAAIGFARGSAAWPAGAVFGAAVGAALLLRGRTYASGRCRAGLTLAGVAALTATFCCTVAAIPQHGHWAAAAAVAGGVVAICHDARSESTPVVARAVEVAEYVALAAVVPTACAALGLFDVVRHASLL
ncbi:type VII secretion integral membrane protein EccD [Mycobacterium sp. PS03-16]|uniref:type VII secretion integral membrane protein EccD n=1 Tax=Mycobacterium sp. PS03-16 TaxID=2559611 RepID=UPI00107470A8|nr:type VII secretion integral membrane protein EccD [Mycobacterium sp. PS03-16]TFV54845.1 type VII secretion integral membrane protein EccD [Mycobacterium sp. PS03-16]